MMAAVLLLSRASTTARVGTLAARAPVAAIRCCASEANPPPPPPAAALGDSKSTLQFEEEAFHRGAAQRAKALAEALEERGFAADQLHALLNEAEYRGSSALRVRLARG